MRLAPPQLQRRGMTGNVPYYGGRLTPAQTYAVSHQRPHAPRPLTKDERARVALKQLLDAGILTPEEHTEYSRRIGS